MKTKRILSTILTFAMIANIIMVGTISVSAAEKVNIKEGITYESSKEFDNYKITPLYSNTFVSAYMRLWIGISKNEDLNKIF